MRIDRSGEKSIAFFTSYMELILLAEIVSIEDLETYMIQHFFQEDVSSLGPITRANFKEALQIVQKK